MGVQLLDARKKGPLVRPRGQVVVHKDAVPFVPRCLLQRQRNQVAESSLWHRVLIGEKAVVRIETDLGPTFHRFGEEVRSKPPGQGRGHRLLEEEPHVRALSGARSFERDRHGDTPARINECSHVFPPCRLVEVDNEEKTPLVRQERINTGDERRAMSVDAGQMPPDDGVGHRKESAIRTFGAFDAGFFADVAYPLIGTGWCIAGTTGPPALKSARIDVVPPSK